ncbi:MAG TPA: DUF4349 domain-containing protein [Symbiobacteriaceae bacterium]|nr:DUF4349 domain-containing protein [Symbiobacteriaceae bacterium]
MTERKRALTDLRPAAQETLFAGWRVTPELKAKLRARISQAEAAPTRKAPKARKPWQRWGGATAVAAAAVVTLAILGQPPVVKEEARPAEVSAAAVTDGYGRSGAPAEGLMKPPGSAEYTVTVMDEAGPPLSGVEAKGKAFQVVTTGASAVEFDNDDTAVTAVPAVEAQPGRKIVLNAEYQLQVTDAVTAMQRLQTLAATTAGYVVDAALNKGHDGSWAGRLTLRLPSGQYNGAIAEIRRIGEVQQERQWSQDVTERYYDLEARIRIQEEYERKLQELAAKATTFDDWMKLTRQINDTRALIEQMQGSLKLLSNQVEYSTINILFTQPAPGKEPPPPPDEDKGLWASMTRAFQRSIDWFGALGQSLLVGAAAVAPFLVAVAVFGLIGLALWRRRRTGPSA